jgi:hypothetical protein
VRSLVALSSCAEVVMVNRKATTLAATDRLRQVGLDTGAVGFQAEVTKLAMRTISLGDPVYGASCVGVGKGSAKWTEEDLKALELGVVGGFARGCHDGGIERFALLSAVGSSSKSRIRYVRIMGLKEETVAAIGFKRLAIFQPGIIGGNVHTLGRSVRGSEADRSVPAPSPGWDDSSPDGSGRSNRTISGGVFAAEFINSSAPNGVVYLENTAMKQMSHALTLGGIP